MPSINWVDADDQFTAWVRDRLPEIASAISSSMSPERDRLSARAAARGQGTSLRDFIPHIVIVIALAAFAYMFAIVHIKI